MKEEISKIVEDACKRETNYFGYGIWTYHILLVVKYSKLMAEKLNADREVVEISALLHDYAGIKDHDLWEDHHLHGAVLAEQVLKKFNYPPDKIKQIKHCITSHRGSKNSQKRFKEAICLADADAMAHFDSIPSLFFMTFFSHKMNIDEASDWISQKLERSWNKLSPQAKVIIKDKYKASKLLLGDRG
jgi:HD superfamily phosphohydrolase YqeK